MSLIAALTLALISQAAVAQSNFTFDNGAEGWGRSSGAGAAPWSNLDASFSTGSGSLVVSDSIVGVCINTLSLFTHHTLSAKVLVPPGQSGLAAIRVYFWDQPGCRGSLGRTDFQDILDFQDAFGGWLPLKFDTRTVDQDVNRVIPGARSATLEITAVGTAYFDDVRLTPYLAIPGGTFPCVPDSFTACLQGERFQVDVGWEATGNQDGPGVVVPQTPDSANFWFFNKENFELLIKVLDGCSLGGNYWVFVAGMTDVRVNIEVIDTFTGEIRQYMNPMGLPFQPILDTGAFPCV